MSRLPVLTERSSTPATGADTAALDADSGRRLGDPLRPIAAAALIAGPVLFCLGMLTSPEQASPSDADYLAALSRDATLTQVSALLLHYANILIGAGVLAATGLVRGVRGRALVAVGAVVTALGFLNVSGQLLADWFALSLGSRLDSATAVEVFRGALSADLMPLWHGTELLALVGPLLLFAGLVRAGVLARWTPFVYAGGFVGMFAVPLDVPQLGAAAILVAFSPFVLVGARLVRRHRAGVA